MTFIPRPGNFVYLIRHFTHYEWPFEMFIEIFGSLKIDESTVSDKDEKVQRRTAEVYVENLRNTKICHSSSTRVAASLWNQGRKKKVAVHSKILWESQSPLWYNRISSRNSKKRPRTKRTRENAEKLKVILNDKQQFSVRNIAPQLTLSPTVWSIMRYDTKAKF